MCLLSDVRMSLFRPREDTQRQFDERIARVPECGNGVVPCEQRSEQTEPSAGFEPMHLLPEIVSDGQTHKCDCKEEEEAKECD